jgi:hypothetical protein
LGTSIEKIYTSPFPPQSSQPVGAVQSSYQRLLFL